jgi:hypothetical protein
MRLEASKLVEEAREPLSHLDELLPSNEEDQFAWRQRHLAAQRGQSLPSIGHPLRSLP